MDLTTKRILLCLFFLGLTPLLMADIGPKPTAEFEIEYRIDPVPELTGYAMYECRDPDCHEAYLLEKLGPQHFDCDQDSCSSMAYGFSDSMYIELSFSDGVTRTSNIFSRKHFNAEYRIEVNQHDLVVNETGGSPPGGLDPLSYGISILVGVGCCLPILLAGAIAVIVLVRRKKRVSEAMIKKTLESEG